MIITEVLCSVEVCVKNTQICALPWWKVTLQIKSSQTVHTHCIRVHHLHHSVMMYLFVICWALIVATVVCAEEFHLMHKSISRNDFIKMEASHPDTLHKLVFAVKQSNLIEADALLMERSTPGSPRYQEWLTFEEVGELTSNIEGAEAVLNWLAENGVTMVDTTMRFEYITAFASIATWEKLLNTKFFRFEDHSKNSLRANSGVIHRAEEYSLPTSLRSHVHCVFYTVQVPPVIHQKRHSLAAGAGNEHDNTKLDARPAFKTLASTPSSFVTVEFLNNLYSISSNNASGVATQSVFETSEEYFSPDDLSLFQATYDLPSQECSAPYGYTSDSCSTVDCYEGNLDVQYIMGVAQQATTIYWYLSNDNTTTDPFVAWVTDIASATNPPLVNSMSWGTIEQVKHNTQLFYLPSTL